MHFNSKFNELYANIDRKFQEQFGFPLKETKFTNIVEYLHAPKDSSSLAVVRILYGLAMLYDIPDERGGATMARRWARHLCHFPLLPFVQAVPMPYMALVYTALWFGALGIMLGYKYRIASTMFVICYWYLILIEKSFWNNHSYLFGLVGLLLSCTQADCCWSLDTYMDPGKSKDTVPYWNYFILKYQFFILYFMAGMKKGTAEWLTGYSVQKLAEHWVFDPFKLFLSVSQIDYLIVHWFIFIFDLTVALWMMWARTRHIAMLFCAMFHLMNSRLFRIGMFPWVCLATMPLYYPFDWPKICLRYIRNIAKSINDYWNPAEISAVCNCKAIKYETRNRDDDGDADDVFIGENSEKQHDVVHADESSNKENSTVINKETSVSNDIEEDYETAEEINDQMTDLKNKDLKEGCEDGKSNVDPRKKLTTYLIIIYVLTQAFLPYSHFMTKGYNNWTNGLYGYSWDMMVHTWDTQSVIVKIVDNESNQEHFIDSSYYAPNDRWTRHGDMAYQFAQCLKENLLKDRIFLEEPMSSNISIYVDIWCSMNGRFTQRLFDPKVDLFQASWSPFSRISYLMPLLDQAVHWRRKLQEITEAVHSWNNRSEVVFFAEFPNYDQEKFIPVELSNVTLTVLEGSVVYEPEVPGQLIGQCFRVTTRQQIYVQPGLFHKIVNIDQNPAYYMYIFTNATESNSEMEIKTKPKLPIWNELLVRFKGMLFFASLVSQSLFQILFGCSGKC